MVYGIRYGFFSFPFSFPLLLESFERCKYQIIDQILSFLGLQVSDQEAVDLARPWCMGIDKPEPLTACKNLVDLSVSRGSGDDISVMLIQLRRYI